MLCGYAELRIGKVGDRHLADVAELARQHVGIGCIRYRIGIPRVESNGRVLMQGLDQNMLNRHLGARGNLLADCQKLLHT